MKQLQHMEAIEKRLWKAADTMRSNSELTSNEYFMPVMGVDFSSLCLQSLFKR